MEVKFFVKQVWHGKTAGRALFNAYARENLSSLKGTALDLAGGGTAGYLSYCPVDLRVVRTDVYEGDGIQRVDIAQPLPFADASFDHVLLFNALYTIAQPELLIREMHRVLTPNGSALIASPFLSNEMPEPHDYQRLTREGLRTLFSEAGFSHIDIKPYGERFTVMADLIHPFLPWAFVRVPIYTLAYMCDHYISARLRARHPAPIGYFCTLKK